MWTATHRAAPDAALPECRGEQVSGRLDLGIGDRVVGLDQRDGVRTLVGAGFEQGERGGRGRRRPVLAAAEGEDGRLLFNGHEADVAEGRPRAEALEDARQVGAEPLDLGRGEAAGVVDDLEVEAAAGRHREDGERVARGLVPVDTAHEPREARRARAA